ncbi:MAG: GTPase Era [Oscillospiraceae bacterium]|jgi:GTP-binding protein Era|nr:GTPase Era [Oscillospiraceae bacterium]MDD3261033.1 GTPase Era [Oscillospiraceae bacterium]
MKNNQENDRSAFFAIVGRPNVGKSSLMNRILGQKVAIVSSKPQTTRTRIMGVLTEGRDQLVFLDTPGLLKPRDKLGEYMVKSVTSSVAGVDAALLVVEAGTEISPADEELLERFRSQKLPAVLAINKIDLLQEKERLIPQIAKLSEKYPFAAVVPVSARTGDGVPDLKDELKKHCQPGGHMFPDDTLTDQPERVLAGEFVREKMLRLLNKEVPHGVAVVVHHLEERPDGSCLDIDADIYCERESHKGIIIGKGGSMIRKIGTQAREELERFYGIKVNLQLQVMVKPNWRNKEAALRSFGFDTKDLLQ